ncbi:MAG: sensor histidine kinase [Treponema sp.]|nr:sensor histidine kinase [Treponema sp.]
MNKLQNLSLEPEDILFYGEKIIPTCINILCIITAYINFSLKYLSHNEAVILSLNTVPYMSGTLFIIDFYFFSILYTIFLFILIFKKEFRFELLSIIFTITTAVLLDYTMGDLLTIKMFIFASWILTIAVSFDFKYSCFLITAGSFIFIIFQYHPQSLGIVTAPITDSEPDTMQVFTLAAYFIIFAVMAGLYRFAVIKTAENISIAQHLNMVMTQMSQFNRKLQEAAKNRGEEAVKQERMRISRDMHDSCGYVFVNIVALMDAAESEGPKTWKETEKIFETVRNLASKSLKDTRITLHAMREIQTPLETTIHILQGIKDLFQKVTGIKVHLDTGNLQHDYGRTINEAITPIMQEALTNAVRHGRATEISIWLWDDKDNLLVTVKDNGVGSKKVVKGIGIAGMEERLAKIKGTLETTTSVEGGFRLTISIPLTGQENENEEFKSITC